MEYSSVKHASVIPHSAMDRNNTIVLFDVDGTLTIPRNKVKQSMLDQLSRLRKTVTIGIVGGSDTAKIKEQMGDDIISKVDYFFSENGLVAYKDEKLIGKTSILKYLGNEKLNKFINVVLRYLSNIDLPVKRGTFIEFRNGMLNISPIGRNCSQEERIDFLKYDNIHNIRKYMITYLQSVFHDFDLTYSIGGQISFDVFPIGWDKTYCLQYIGNNFKQIYFFGDNTHKGGNDYEIYNDNRVNGYTVKSYNETMTYINKIFM